MKKTSTSATPTIRTANTFAHLPEAEEGEVIDAADVPLPKKEYVPPVYVPKSAKEVIDVLQKEESLKARGAFFITRVAGGRVSVKASSLALRRTVIGRLENEKFEYFSFTPRSEKPFKAVLFGLEGFGEKGVLEELLAAEELPVKPSSVVAMKRFNAQKMEKDVLRLVPRGDENATTEGTSSECGAASACCGHRRPPCSATVAHRFKPYKFPVLILGVNSNDGD